nr:hypothetical protein [Tanacetum cinerariifolium]
MFEKPPAVEIYDLVDVLHSCRQSPEYKKHSNVACIMLGKMSPALQRQFENYPLQNMLAELRKMFEKPPAVEIYDLVDVLHSCRQSPGKPVSEHVLEMKGLMD